MTSPLVQTGIHVLCNSHLRETSTGGQRWQTSGWGRDTQIFRHKLKQAFIDIRLRPGRARPSVAHQAGHATPYGPLRPNVTSSIKPEAEIHNIAQRRQRRTEPWPQGICIKISCRSVQRFQRYARGQTDTHRYTHTHRRVDHNTPHPCQGGVKKT